MMPTPQEISRELAGSEKVLWTGQPRQDIVIRAFDAFVIPFSLVWCGDVFFILFERVKAPNTPLFFVLFALVFVAIGIYLVVGRFLTEAKQRARTFYAVTNDRTVIVSGLFSRTVKSIDLKTLREMALSERGNGSGSIVFGSSSPLEWMFASMPAWPGMQGRSASRFDVIADVRSVYNTIRSPQRALTR